MQHRPSGVLRRFVSTISIAATVVMPFSPLAASTASAVAGISTYSDAACTVPAATFNAGEVVYVGGVDYVGPAVEVQWSVEPIDYGVGGPVLADGTFCIATHTIGVSESGEYTVTVTQSFGDDAIIRNADYQVPVEEESSAPEPAQIIIVKETEDGDGRFEFTVTDSSETQQSGTVTTEEGIGSVSFEVFPDEEGSTYSVQETIPAGWILDDAYCEYDGEEAGIPIDNGEDVELDPGDEVTCYFENSYQSPGEGDALIRVVKLTEGGDGEFIFSGPGDEPFSMETSEGYDERFFYVSADSEAGTPVTIAEDAQEGWDLSDLTCYNSEEGFSYEGASVLVTVYPGDEVTCTFTNTSDEDQGGEEGGGGRGAPHPRATLIVEKVILFGEDASVSFSDFSFWLDGDLHQFEEDGSNEFSLRSGDYMVTEDYTSGFTVGYSGDCDEDGNLEMIGDETYVCTVTNTAGVGGFNPGSEVPAPTPTPTPTPGPGGSSIGDGSITEDDFESASEVDITGESDIPASGSSDAGKNLSAAAIGSLADWPVCVPGGLGWILVNLGLYLLALLWLQRGDWKKAFVILAILAAVLTWLAGECGNNPGWISAALGFVSLLWLRLRNRAAN